MPYKLQAVETVRDGLRRCAREQLDSAIEELTTGVHDDPVEAVHDARKALKKARSLLRLCRGAIEGDDRRRENAALRHAGQALSGARDAEVKVQAVDDLSRRFAGRLPQSAFDAVRRHLEADRDPARRRLLESGLTGQVADELRLVRRRIDELPLRDGGWQAMAPGLLRTYRRGRDAMQLAHAEPSAENLHEWRKRTKDLWYHLRILGPMAPAIIGGQVKDADELSNLLGEDHDLAVLHETLEQGASELAIDLDSVLELIDHRREQLQAEAMLVGRRLYAEPCKAFHRRLHDYWKAWRRATREPRRSLAVPSA
jgi:CHAD domain-containing protein